MTTDNPTGLQRLKRWAALLRAENNSLGHTLETYAMEWEEDLAALSTAPVQVDLQTAAKPLHEMSAEELTGLARDTLTPQTPVDALRLALDNCGFGPGDTRARLVAEFCAVLPVVQPVVPADVAQAARLFVAADYRGPLFMARKVFDWVASLPAAPASDADSMQQPKEN